MKKILSILSIATVAVLLFTACNRKSDTAGTSQLSYSDTVGLAQFQNWKMQNETLNPNQYQQAAQRTTVPKAPARTTRKPAPNYGSGSMSSMSQNTAKVQKKGWSKAAKGAAIGGGAGAIAGAVLIKKNRLAGGAIGGIVGAGIGYLIGHSKDKKDGRY
jgi:hypothetical protein